MLEVYTHFCKGLMIWFFFPVWYLLSLWLQTSESSQKVRVTSNFSLKVKTEMVITKAKTEFREMKQSLWRNTCCYKRDSAIGWTENSSFIDTSFGTERAAEVKVTILKCLPWGSERYWKSLRSPPQVGRFPRQHLSLLLQPCLDGKHAPLWDCVQADVIVLHEWTLPPYYSFQLKQHRGLRQ